METHALGMGGIRDEPKPDLRRRHFWLVDKFNSFICCVIGEGNQNVHVP